MDNVNELQNTIEHTSFRTVSITLDQDKIILFKEKIFEKKDKKKIQKAKAVIDALPILF